MSIRGSLAAATVLASALALSGCSDDSSATESSETPASPTASASPDLPDDAMSTEPARPKDKKTPRARSSSAGTSWSRSGTPTSRATPRR